MDTFALYFDRTGLRGADTPTETDPIKLAENFAFIKRVSQAIEDFGTRIQEIEAAHDELIAARSTKQ